MSNYDNAGINNGISIVISRKPNEGITNDGNAHLVEYFYPDKKINSADGKPLVEILKSIKQALYSGEYKDNTGLAQREEVNIPDFLRTGDGTVYGWAVNGKIFLTPEGMNPNTPAHEYTHLWASMIEKNDPKLWSRIVEVMKESLTWNEVLLDEAYRDIHNNDSRMASEVLSRLSGEENYRRAMELAEREIKAADGIIEKAKKIALWGRIKQALADFWASVKGVFGFKDKAPWMEFVNMALGDLYGGVNPNAVGSPLERMFIGERGAANLDMAEEASLRLDNLNVAREMEEAGKGAKAIKIATGWERGADGKWRYEVMDDFKVELPDTAKEFVRYKELVAKRSKLQLEDKELSIAEYDELERLGERWEGGFVPDVEGVGLTDLTNAVDLFDAYPKIAGIQVEFYPRSGTLGGYNEATNTIYLSLAQTAESIKSTLVHEIQHAVQHIEGFARGGNKDSVKTKKSALKSDVAPLYEMMLETPEWAEKQRLLNRWFDETDEAVIAQIEARVEEIDNSGVLKDIEAKQAELQKKYGLDRTVGRIISSPYAMDAEIWNELPDSFNDRFEAYRSLAGEVEARNVQSRMGMTEEERRNSLAVETEDVAREDQVFIEENLGVSASIYGGNSGYVGYSMSKRAEEARKEGRFPKTDFKKNYGLSEKVFAALVDAGIVSGNEWHHTSVFGNRTTFYSWENKGAADFFEQNKERVAEAVKNGTLNELKNEFERAAEDYQDKEIERYRQEAETAEREKRLRDEYDAYLKETLLPKDGTFVASNGVVVRHNGALGSSSWIAEMDGGRLSKRNGKEKRDAAFAEFKEFVDKAPRLSFEEWKEQENDIRFREDGEDVPRLTKHRVEKIFGGIWLGDSAEYRNFTSAAISQGYDKNENYVYAGGYFYLYYINNDYDFIPYVAIEASRENKEVIEALKNVIENDGQGDGTQQNISRRAILARSKQTNGVSADKRDSGRTSTTTNGGLVGGGARTGRYLDAPWLYSKAESVEEYTRPSKSTVTDEEFAERKRKRMRQAVDDVASALNTPIEVLESTEGLTGRRAKAKGWYEKSTGRIVVVLPNNKSVAKQSEWLGSIGLIYVIALQMLTLNTSALQMRMGRMIDSFLNSA